LFYAFSSASDAQDSVPLYEYETSDGEYAYSVDGELPSAEWLVADTPLAWVYENPIHAPLPVGDYLGDFIADAGEDQCLSLGGRETISVEVDATSTQATKLPIVSTTWRVTVGEQCTARQGESASFSLPVGTHTIEVLIENEAGELSLATVMVTISE
jgi:hypothetical protein